MDFEAIVFASDKCLEDIGLETKGDILALKAFAQRQGNKQSDAEYEERKRHLIDELRKGRENRLTPKEKKQKTQNIPSATTTSNRTKTRKITFGWMHWIRSPTQSRFVSVRATKGGGSRKVDLPLCSTKDEIISEGKRLFFPDDLSPHGSAKEMVFDIANFKGEMISDSMTDDDQTVPFTLERYINKSRLVNVRIYLTSKPVEKEESSESDDESLLRFSSLSEVQDLPILHDEHIEENENISSSALDSQDVQYKETNSFSEVENYDSNTVTQLETSIASPAESSLIGTSDERAGLLMDQNNAYHQALEEDIRKEKEKADTQENLHRLEVKRAARLSRVPKEPGMGEPRVRVAVQHLTIGKIIRNFPQDAIATAIYDWVGSVALEPENFSLCLYPGKAVDLFESVSNVAGSLLYMEVAQDESGGNGTASRY